MRCFSTGVCCWCVATWGSKTVSVQIIRSWIKTQIDQKQKQQCKRGSGKEPRSIMTFKCSRAESHRCDETVLIKGQKKCVSSSRNIAKTNDIPGFVKQMRQPGDSQKCVIPKRIWYMAIFIYACGYVQHISIPSLYIFFKKKVYQCA